MAVMAIVCVAVVMGGELRLGPLAKLLLAARSDDETRNPAMVAAAAVVYDEPDVLNAYSLIGPPQIIERKHWTDAGLVGGLPHLGSLSVADDFGPDVSPTHNFLGGGFMALGTSGPGNPTTDQPALTQLSTNTGSFLSAPVSAPTPEPTTWAMMVLGIGGIGAALRQARAAGQRI